ncbi:MAG TPA: alpha/beta fold hydrolase [Flavobacterium sp.]|jgi:pimeloyl-ACP methyl ester carboxylesterase
MKKLKYFLLTKSIGLYINVLSYVAPQKASLLAYRLFSEPRDGRLSKDKLPEILGEAATETFYHNGEAFETYIWKGNEKIVLLVHGWESNASRWEKFLPHLKETGSTIIAIDGPAHGLSAGKEFNVPKYAEFIDVVVQKYQPQYLIGHSLGGAACVYYQSAYPNSSIHKMIVLGAPSDLKILITNYVKLLSLNSKMVQLLENHFLQKFKFRLDDFSGRIFGSKLRLRGIIAHDVDDTIVAFAESKKIAESWKDALFIETKGLGHSMHDKDLYQKLTKFLSED